MSTSTRESWELPGDVTRCLLEHSRRVACDGGVDSDRANDVAHMTLLSLNKKLTQEPGFLAVLTGPDWRNQTTKATRSMMRRCRHADKRRRACELLSASRELACDFSGEIDDLVVVQALESAASSLPALHRAFVHQRYFLGHSIAQIAFDFSLEEATVRAIGFEALSTLEFHLTQ